MAEDVRDVFICHASEDKPSVVKPLTKALTQANISFWLDEEIIQWGDSIIQKVNEGLSKSRYTVVVLSPAFISKYWPQRELSAMLNVEILSGEVKVLLLLVGNAEEKRSILQQLPLLNDKRYLTWENNASDIAEILLKRLGRSNIAEQTSVAQQGPKPAPVSSSAPAGNLQRAQTRPPDWLRYKLVAFDLDGTLLKGYKFSWTLVWDYLGYPKKLQKTGMQRYRAGQTTYKQWCEWACDLFIDKNLKREDFQRITEQVSLTKNFYDTIRKLKREGLILAIISGGIDTFIEEKIPDADKLFDYIFINKLIFDERGRLNGVISTDYDFAGKAKALQLLCEVNEIKVAETVFVGEGFNDEEVACIAGLCIAYPPTDQGVDEVAGIGIEEDDLSLVLEHVLSR